MGYLKKKTLPFLLLFVSLYVHRTPSQEADIARQRKPFFERLRRLEEQVGVPHLGDWFYKRRSRLRMNATESAPLCDPGTQRALGLLSLREANGILTSFWKPGKHLVGSALKSN